MNKIYLVRHFSFDQSKVLRFEIEIEALKRSKQVFNLSWDSLIFLSQRSVLIFFRKMVTKEILSKLQNLRNLFGEKFERPVLFWKFSTMKFCEESIILKNYKVYLLY